MSSLALAVCTISALISAVISAIAGMGGGITLLAILTFFLPHSLLIPIHGAVQFLSNSTRLLLFIKDLNLKAFLKFSVLAVPLSFVGAKLLQSMDPKIGKLAIVLFIFYTLFLKNKTRFPAFLNSFYLAGALAGLISMVVGATGPLIAPFFLENNMKKEEVIATKATCQALVHLLKIFVFSAVFDFQFSNHLALVVPMGLAVILGTWIGKTILKKYISQELFEYIFKSILLIVALKILVVDVLGLHLLYNAPVQ